VIAVNFLALPELVKPAKMAICSSLKTSAVCLNISQKFYQMKIAEKDERKSLEIIKAHDFNENRASF